MTVPIGFHIDDEFFDDAKSAVIADKRMVAIVLIAVTVEHSLNSFYRDLFSYKYSLPEKEATEIIKGTNIATKIGWLLNISAHYALDDELKKEILGLMELRNQIVHFKYVSGTSFDDDSGSSHSLIRRQVEQLNVPELLAIRDRLLEKLEEALVNACPDLKLAYEAAEAIETGDKHEFIEVKQEVEELIRELKTSVKQTHSVITHIERMMDTTEEMDMQGLAEASQYKRRLQECEDRLKRFKRQISKTSKRDPEKIGKANYMEELIGIAGELSATVHEVTAWASKQNDRLGQEPAK